MKLHYGPEIDSFLSYFGRRSLIIAVIEEATIPRRVDFFGQKGQQPVIEFELGAHLMP